MRLMRLTKKELGGLRHWLLNHQALESVGPGPGDGAIVDLQGGGGVEVAENQLAVSAAWSLALEEGTKAAGGSYG